MMDQIQLDPYEQQLLSVFDSYDHDNCGSLDRDGLMQLCQTLQLEEQGNDLIHCLLKDPKHSRATFNEFKDALLTLLGNIQQHDNNIEEKNKEIDGSPDREVSPKFVYGSKKYGRRSRPRNDEILEENNYNKLNNVQRSNSQSEVSSKKRKTNYKLKRCTSLPANRQGFKNEDFGENYLDHSVLNEPEFLCTEEMLREAWKKLGVGKDGYLNQTELVLVCDAIGLEKLAKGVIRQLSDKLSIDYNHRISFQELLEALQQDETWSEVLESTITTTPDLSDVKELTEVNNHQQHEIFPDSRTFQFITLGPDGNGQISAEMLIDIWEQIGITSPKELIHEFGFNNHQINVADLASVLEKEVKGLQDSSNDYYNHHPHFALLQANLALYQCEIKCLKQILEQMHAEREKLKCDVFEANNRAKLLAQEVDDNHQKMERNTQNQVKLIEQRHADILKEIAQQFSSDKEHLNQLNHSLEMKIQNLEMEATKLKNDLIIAQKYSTTIEKENQVLSGQLTEMQQIKTILTEQINNLENEKQKYVEMEHKQLEPLLEKLSLLQLENSQLRDKNDEMVAEIENLTSQVSALRTKVTTTNSQQQKIDESMEDNNYSIICEGVGLGAKRRSDYSPSKDDNLLFSDDGSPRLGKVRKFHKNKSTDHSHLDVPFTSNESGFEVDFECPDSSISTTNNDDQEEEDRDEIIRLQAKVAFLEQILIQNNISLPEQHGIEYKQLKERASFLEKTIRNIKIELNKMLHYKNGLTNDCLKVLNEKLANVLNEQQQRQQQDASCETDKNNSIENLIAKYENENKDLSVKCNELENCVELLRNEYEKCEDYWQSKLDEERQMFEQEQNQSSEKLADLINKMAEYEQQFTQNDNRLQTIEETYNLEKQYTDLEQEFDDYKQQSEMELFKKNEEISILKQKLTDLALEEEEKVKEEVAVQADDDKTLLSKKMANLSTCVVESTNVFSADAMPFVWNDENEKKDLDSSLIWSNQQQPSTSSTCSEKTSCSTTPCRPKRTRKHDRSNNLYKKNQDLKKTDEFNLSGKSTGNGEQMIAVPVTTIHNLNGRLHHLEQRCRQLQMVLKQQHYYTEQALNQCWQHHMGEKAELHSILRNQQEKLDHQVKICNEQLERLTRSDMLVKDLYVENSYLIAKVQRLEQQYQFLAQNNSNCSSV